MILAVLKASKTLKKLEDLYFSGKLVTFTTSKKTYSSMAMISLTVPETDEMANAVEVKFTLKQIRIVKSKTVTIPAEYGLSGSTAASGGTSSTTTEEDKETVSKSCSWLYSLFKK